MAIAKTYAEEQPFDPRNIAQYHKIKNHGFENIEFQHEFYHHGVLIFQARVEVNITRRKTAKKPLRFLVLGETSSDREIVTTRATGILQTTIGLDLVGKLKAVPDNDMQWSSGLQLKWRLHAAGKGNKATWARNDIFKDRKAYCKRICDLFSGKENTEVASLAWDEVDWDAIKGIIDENEKLRDKDEGFKLNIPAGMQVGSEGVLTPLPPKRKKNATDTNNRPYNLATSAEVTNESDEPAAIFVVDQFGNLSPHEKEKATELYGLLNWSAFPFKKHQLVTLVMLLNRAYPGHDLKVEHLERFRASRDAWTSTSLHWWTPFRRWWDAVRNGSQADPITTPTPTYAPTSTLRN